MDNQSVVTRTKNGWKTTGIILIILSVAFAAVMGFFVCKSIDQQSKISDLENKIKQLEVKDSNSSDINTDIEVKYLSHATNGGFTFDYPEGWSVTDTHYTKSPMTIVTTKDGYKIALVESLTGLGGMCIPEEMPTTTVHKEADSQISGKSVISYTNKVDYGSGFVDNFILAVSSYDGEYDTPVSVCDLSYAWANSSPNFSFSNYDYGFEGNDVQPSRAEYPEIVKMLASLRKK